MSVLSLHSIISSKRTINGQNMPKITEKKENLKIYIY